MNKKHLEGVKMGGSCTGRRRNKVCQLNGDMGKEYIWGKFSSICVKYTQ